MMKKKSGMECSGKIFKIALICISLFLQIDVVESALEVNVNNESQTLAEFLNVEGSTHWTYQEQDEWVVRQNKVIDYLVNKLGYTRLNVTQAINDLIYSEIHGKDDVPPMLEHPVPDSFHMDDFSTLPETPPEVDSPPAVETPSIVETPPVVMENDDNPQTLAEFLNVEGSTHWTYQEQDEWVVRQNKVIDYLVNKLGYTRLNVTQAINDLIYSEIHGKDDVPSMLEHPVPDSFHMDDFSTLPETPPPVDTPPVVETPPIAETLPVVMENDDNPQTLAEFLNVEGSTYWTYQEQDEWVVRKNKVIDYLVNELGYGRPDVTHAIYDLIYSEIHGKDDVPSMLEHPVPDDFLSTPSGVLSDEPLFYSSNEETWSWDDVYIESGTVVSLLPLGDRDGLDEEHYLSQRQKVITYLEVVGYDKKKVKNAINDFYDSSGEVIHPILLNPYIKSGVIHAKNIHGNHDIKVRFHADFFKGDIVVGGVSYPLNTKGRIQTKDSKARYDFRSTVNRKEGKTDYLSYGVWMNKDKKVKSSVFYQGSNPVRPSDMKQVSGSATYKGQTVGAYHSKKDSDTADPSANGTFSGRVELTADFDKNTIKGSVLIRKYQSIERSPVKNVDDTADTPLHKNNKIKLQEASISKNGKFKGRAKLDGNKGGYEGRFYNHDSDTGKPENAAGLYHVSDENYKYHGSFNTSIRKSKP